MLQQFVTWHLIYSSIGLVSYFYQVEQNVLPVKKDHPHPMEEGSVDWLSFDMRGPSLNTKNLPNVWLIDGKFPRETILVHWKGMKNVVFNHECQLNPGWSMRVLYFFRWSSNPRLFAFSLSSLLMLCDLITASSCHLFAARAAWRRSSHPSPASVPEVLPVKRALEHSWILNKATKAVTGASTWSNLIIYHRNRTPHFARFPMDFWEVEQ